MFNAPMASAKTTARFIPPMLLLRRERLPEGPEWLYELKLDGYRALAIKTGGKVHLRLRNDNDFNARYPGIVKALANLPDETVIPRVPSIVNRHVQWEPCRSLHRISC